MKLSQPYIEMLNRGINRSQAEGARSYPSAAMEIMLLDHAQHRVHHREANTFRELCTIFDWQLSRFQQNHYLRQLKQGDTLILTDTAKEILWTSHSFMRMTGHRVADAVGQKPSMLQGPATELMVRDRIRQQLDRAESVQADMQNYRKDGTMYTCHITIDPLRNRQGELTHFLAVECEVD